MKRALSLTARLSITTSARHPGIRRAARLPPRTERFTTYRSEPARTLPSTRPAQQARTSRSSLAASLIRYAVKLGQYPRPVHPALDTELSQTQSLVLARALMLQPRGEK